MSFKRPMAILATLLFAVLALGCGNSAQPASSQAASSGDAQASSAPAASSAQQDAQATSAASSAPASASSATSSQVVDYSVDTQKDLFDVTITVGAAYANGATQEELDAAAAEKGYQSATLNDDGSVTYVMTRAQHNQMMDDLRAEFDKSLSEMPGSEDYPNVTAIEHNDDFTNFTITSTSAEPSMQESLMVLGLYMYGGMYTSLNGAEADNVHVDFVNADTGEVVQSADSKDLGKTSSQPPAA